MNSSTSSSDWAPRGALPLQLSRCVRRVAAGERVLVTDRGRVVAELVRAGRPFPAEPIQTLDAVYLASIELLGEPPQLVTVVARNRRIAANARALGYRVS